MRKSPIRLMNTQTKITHLLFAFTSIFDLLSRLRQQKAHICLPRQMCASFNEIFAQNEKSEKISIIFKYVRYGPLVMPIS